jgi:hypothetical protein
MLAQRIQSAARNERVARQAGFWWGLAEGLAFFIVPDVYISFATVFALRAGVIAWMFSVLGSLIAVCLVWVLVTIIGMGGGYISFLEMLPGISRDLVETNTVRLAADGLPYTPLLILGGIPLKVYAAIAFMIGTPLGGVLVWTLFARFVRIAPVFALVALVRFAMRSHVDTHPRFWITLHVIAWVLFYAFYFWKMD